MAIERPASRGYEFEHLPIYENSISLARPRAESELHASVCVRAAGRSKSNLESCLFGEEHNDLLREGSSIYGFFFV